MMRKQITFEVFVECTKCGWEGRVAVKGRDGDYDLPVCPNCGSEEMKEIIK